MRTINSMPFHPATCGKIERFWQTLKKWLAARDPALTLAELNELLEEFHDLGCSPFAYEDYPRTLTPGVHANGLRSLPRSGFHWLRPLVQAVLYGH